MQISGLELTCSDVMQSQSHYKQAWPDIATHATVSSPSANAPVASSSTLQSAHLTLRSIVPSPPAPTPSNGLSAYWKFSVFTDDVEATRTRLIRLGWHVTEPVQFLDIGYLCHTADRDGLSIELLQREFVPPRPRPIEPSPTHWLRGPETLGLITLRISSVEPSLAFYQEVLDMKLLASMEINDGRAEPFSLYFLACTSETAPNPDPQSVDNRAWLYHRPYTIIELQHHWAVDGQSGHELWHAPASVPGFAHVDLQTDTVDSIRNRAQRVGAVVEIHPQTLLLNSPDGHRFRVSPCSPLLNL